MKRIALIMLCALCASLLGTNPTRVQAEDMKRWKIVDSNGDFVTNSNSFTPIVVEGLPSVYSTYKIYFDPGGEGVSPNRCASGCTFVLDSYQNEEGTTTTTASSTTTVVGVTTTTISGGSDSGTTTTTTAPSSDGPFTGWTLRIAQLSQSQMQINGCLDYIVNGPTEPLIITASWTIKKDGVTVGSGSGTVNGLVLSSSSYPACPTEFLANVWCLTASTEYVVTYTGGISGNIVTGSRTIVTSNAPPTTTTTTTTEVPTTTTTEVPTTTTTAALLWKVSSLKAGQVKSLSVVAKSNSPGVKTWSKTGSCVLTPTRKPTTLTMGSTGSCTLTLKIAKSGKYPAKASSKTITRATTVPVRPSGMNSEMYSLAAFTVRGDRLRALR